MVSWNTGMRSVIVSKPFQWSLACLPVLEWRNANKDVYDWLRAHPYDSRRAVMFYALRGIAERIGNPFALPRKFRCPFRVVIDKEIDIVSEPKHPAS